MFYQWVMGHGLMRDAASIVISCVYSIYVLYSVYYNSDLSDISVFLRYSPLFSDEGSFAIGESY